MFKKPMLKKPKSFFVKAAVTTAVQADTRPIFSEDRTAAAFWRTDRARFLDSEQMNVALKIALQTSTDGKKPSSSQELMVSKIFELLLVELRDSKGVRIEDMLSVLGGLAGFSCQMFIREMLVVPGKLSEDKAFVIFETKSGERFFFGDFLNQGLMEHRPGEMSIWAIVGGAVQHLNKPLPDLNAIAGHSAGLVGSPNYGTPNLPADHMPRSPNEASLWKYWNVIRNQLVIAEGTGSMTWPFTLALAGQKFIFQIKDHFDPTLAAQIFMEAAISMSKLDPDRIHGAYIPRGPIRIR